MIDKKELIQEKAKQLQMIYPIEAINGSHYTIWACGRRDGLVSEELYYEAEKHYGSSWHSVCK